MSTNLTDMEKTALIIYAHPDVKSINGSLLEVTRKTLKANGYDVVISDLYSEYVEPSLARSCRIVDPLEVDYSKGMSGDKQISFDIKSEIDKVNKADLLIFHFHMKHNTVPGILRDWLDHLLFSGKMFCFSNSMLGEGLMKGKRALLSVTMDEQAATKENINIILWSIQNSVLRMCGFDMLQPQCSNSSNNRDDSEEKKLLNDWGKRLSNIETEEVNSCLCIPDFKQIMGMIKKDKAREIKRQEFIERSMSQYMPKVLSH